MTERLSELLVREADDLHVPVPPAADVVAAGRRLRRRRRAGTVACGTVAAALVIAGAALLVGPDDERAVEPAPAVPERPVVDVGATFTVGDTVYLDGGAVRAEVPGLGGTEPMLTSAGVVVRDGASATTFVGPDGTTTRLSAPGSAASSTDAAQPLLAWTEEVDGVVTVVVLDVVSDERVAEVAVPQHAGGFAPVALDGDHVYVGDLGTGDSAGDGDARVFDVRWATGEVDVAAGLEIADEIAGGRSNVGYGGPVRVVDVATGATLVQRETPAASGSYFRLSPDGRFAVLTDQSGRSGPIEVVDVDSGTSVTLPQRYYGWTPSGEMIAVTDDDVLHTCSPATGRCTTTRLDVDVSDDARATPAGTGWSS